MTLRLDAALAQDVDVARRVLGLSAVEFIRVAVAEHLEELCADAGFQSEVMALIESNRQAIARTRSLPG